MALETVIYQQDPLFYGCIDYNYSTELGEFGVEDVKVIAGEQSPVIDCDWESPPPSIGQSQSTTSSSAESRRKRRRRSKASKNREELESQRMTHIAVERNRRRQMNDYLAVLRSLMPPSYAQRGDQASIVGGAINFVKELEQLLQFLQAYKFNNLQQEADSDNVWSNFFTFPQYSRRSIADTPTEKQSSVAEIEVSMVETHASVKILVKRMPRQMLKIVSGFESIGLSILHLNVTTLDQSVLYSFSVKVVDECELSTVNEIAGAVHQIVATIQQDKPAVYISNL